ncbi:MAG: DUF4175 family protein, partial [Isosphaeraceae bacterium]
VRFRDLDIAFKIEHRWPGLNDRLASTVQFLILAREPGDRDDILGSQALRDATVRQTLKEVEAIDFRDAVDPRPARRAMLACASALALALAFVMAAPDLSRIALTRLFNPFSGVNWPQQTHLIIAKMPAKIARGEDFKLEVAVAKGERLPSSAKATYRYDDGRIEVEPLRADSLGRFHGRREAVESPFRVTIAGGDDATAPRRVEVVPPPRLTALTIRLIPPNYTNLPKQTLAPGRTEFQAVRGTLVEIEARANKPLASAVFHLGDVATPLPRSRQGMSGPSLATRFQVAESGSFSFALTDTEGFRSQDKDTTRFEVHALRDEEPRVTIDEPSSDRDVTANANVPVRIAAEDDYGLGLVRLLYKVASGSSEPSAETIIPLWAAESGTSTTKRVEVPHDWDLAPLKLSPGTIITFLADARDLDTIHPKGPKTGRSRELRLRIATPEEINRQMDAQRAEIREAVQRVLAMEKQAQVPVSEAKRALDQLDRLDKASRDDLANAAVIQRQVGERVSNHDDGLDQKIQRYLDDLKNMKLDTPEVKDQMEQMQAGVARIQDNHLTPAEQGLTRATKALDDQDQGGDQKPELANAPKPPTQPAQAKNQSTPPAPNDQGQAKSKSDKHAESSSTKGEGKPDDANSGQPAGPKPEAAENGPKPATTDAPTKPDPKADAAKESLARASEHQQAIADELTRMLDGLKEFDTIRGVVQDAKKLLKGQEELMKQTAEAAAQPDLVGKTPEALTPEQKVSLDNLAARQAEQAKDVQNLENKMDEMSGRLDESDPLGASSLRDAAKQSREQGTASKMNDAASGLENNRMGAAKDNQEQARNNIKELIENLQNRREHELAGLVKELRNAEKDLKNLRARQAKNKEETGKAGQNPNDQERKDQLQKLAKEQEEIQKELKKQLQKLRKLRADAAAQAGSRAAGKMSKAREDQEDDDAEAAEQNQDDALADLDDAEEEVKKARQEAEEQLAMEQLAKMADTLKALGEQQDKLLAETADYQAKQTEGQGLSPSRKASVRGLGRAQGSLKDETNTLIERLTEAPVFKLILERATKNMDLAAQRLRDIQTDDETQVAQRTASRRLKQLLDALKPDKGEAGPPQKGGGEGGGGGGGGDAVTKAAQIKMLKMLQLELNDRTEELDALRQRPKGITPEQEQELDRLETDQRTIADLTIDLTKPKRDDGEED